MICGCILKWAYHHSSCCRMIQDEPGTRYSLLFRGLPGHQVVENEDPRALEPKVFSHFAVSIKSPISTLYSPAPNSFVAFTNPGYSTLGLGSSMILGSRPDPLRKPDSDKEAFKFGCFNYILAACGAATGYMQLKFNVISYSPGVDDWG